MRSLIGEPAEDTSYRHVDGVRPRRRRERDLRRRRRSARRSSSRTRSRAVVSCGGAYAFRPGRAVATRRWSGQMPPRQCDGDARREACAGRCMKSSTSSLSSRGEKWRLHQISRPTSSRHLHLNIAPTTRGGASGRGVVDAGPWTHCCRAVRLLVVVSCLLFVFFLLFRCGFGVISWVPPRGRLPGLPR